MVNRHSKQTIEVNLYSLIKILTRTDHFNDWVAEKDIAEISWEWDDLELVKQYFDSL